jgi:hypothetical protein
MYQNPNSPIPSMHCSRRSAITLLSSALAALVLTLAGCASGDESSGGPAGPTAKIRFDAQPSAAVIINGRDVGVTPVDVNIDIDDAGVLKFNLKVSFDSSKTMGSRGAASKALGGSSSQSSALDWMTGKRLPAKVNVINGNPVESREYAPTNPPGTKSMVERE